MSKVVTDSVKAYFDKRMPPRVHWAIAQVEWNLWEGGPIDRQCRIIREWIDGQSAYYYPVDLYDSEWVGSLPLYPRYAKGRERFDAIDWAVVIVGRGSATYL